MFIVVILFTAFLSYTSAIPPGIVNVKVIETSLFTGMKNALKMALGASLTELTYSILAILAGDYILRFPQVKSYIGWFMVPLFLTLAIVNFNNARKGRSSINESDVSEEEAEKLSKRNYFLRGLGFGIINPQMFPYWFITLLYIKEKFDYESIPYFNVAFVIGAVLGGFLLLYTFAYLASYKREALFRFFKKVNFNMFTGFLFLTLMIIQLIKVLNQ